jgi:hypothetical protein
MLLPSELLFSNIGNNLRNLFVIKTYTKGMNNMNRLTNHSASIISSRFRNVMCLLSHKKETRMNNKMVMALTAALVLFATNAACGLVFVRGTGNVISEERQVSGFNNISVSGGMHLYLSQGDEEMLQIEAEDNILPFIESYVEDGLLVVRYERGRSFRTQYPVRVHAVMVEVREIIGSGGSQIQTKNIESDTLSIVLSGGGGGEFMSIDTTHLSVNFSGGSKGTFSGRAAEQVVCISGGGRYHAEEVESNSTRINLSGGAGGIVWVKDSLDATLSGGSLLEYYGDPRVTQQLSGGSRILNIGQR